MTATTTATVIDEATMRVEFAFCERIVEKVIRDDGSSGEERNAQLRSCVERLQRIAEALSRASLFAPNETLSELPTRSLAYLLVPAYLAYAITEVNVAREKRATYLEAARLHYREFLETLFAYGLIQFRLPWLDDGSVIDDEGATPATATKHSSAVAASGLETAIRARQEKITRLNRLKQLEATLERLRAERDRNAANREDDDDDSATQREVRLVLLRLWSLRALNEFAMIDEELNVLQMCKATQSAGDASSGIPQPQNGSEKPPPLSVFTIGRSEAQKRVFGLGYPSAPKYTVDEWYSHMERSGGFGQAKSPPRQFRVGAKGSDDEGAADEDKDIDNEEKRKRQTERDEWRDTHRRGWGNTWNKG